jgi:RNA polymerase sigma-70 factor (ECF subfamily)
MTAPATARDERARRLVERNLDRIWRTLRRLGTPDANVDDATQKVFMVALRRLDEIEPEREDRYLIGIAVRVASDERRAEARRREVPIADVELAARERPADEVVEDRRNRASLDAVMAAMPAELCEAFVLFELEEMSAPAVAELLDVPVGTVASRVRRAREFVREFLKWGKR